MNIISCLEIGAGRNLAGSSFMLIFTPFPPDCDGGAVVGVGFDDTFGEGEGEEEEGTAAAARFAAVYKAAGFVFPEVSICMVRSRGMKRRKEKEKTKWTLSIAKSNAGKAANRRRHVQCEFFELGQLHSTHIESNEFPGRLCRRPPPLWP